MNSLIAARMRISGLILLSIMLSNCSLPGVRIFQDTDPGTQLGQGESGNTHFFTKETYHNTGISLISGKEYSLHISLLSNWIDSTIENNESGEPLTEVGFDNSLMPLEFLGMTRRSRAHNWFELMLVQPDCSRESVKGVTDLLFNEETQSYQFTAACDGNLNLYVNDSYGFYSNNAGYANITFSRLN